jgi:hypothetical protein
MEKMKKATNNTSETSSHDQNYNWVFFKYKATGWPLHQPAFAIVERKFNRKQGLSQGSGARGTVSMPAVSFLYEMIPPWATALGSFKSTEEQSDSKAVSVRTMRAFDGVEL